MRKAGVKFIFLFLMIFLIANISATGVCTLDKEIYHPGEKATFSCTCTSPLEENAPGNIVWRNSSNDILQNISTNSNACRTNLFGDSLTFQSGANYLGNATFETEEAQWVGDTISDNFNVSGGHIDDCIIVDIVGSPSINPGGHGAVKFDVLDAQTLKPIIHASCIAEAYTSLGQPLVHNPSESGDLGYRMSTAEGEVVFSRQLTEEFWETNTTYFWEFHCFSLPNSTFAELQHIGWYEDGTPSGMKSCTVQQVFSTNGEDLRGLTNFQITVYIFISLLLILLSYFFYEISHKTDFNAWLKKIQATSGKNNIIKVVFVSAAFSFLKEFYLIMYMLLLPVVLMFEALINLANIDSISTITSIFSNIYSIGMLVVVVLFFGKLQRFIMDMVNYTKNEAWGINDK